MLMYQFNEEIMSHIKQDKVIISDYYINSKNNGLTIILEDTAMKTSNRFIKLIFSDYNLSEETFEIKGEPVSQVYVERFVKYFKSNYFIAIGLVIKNSKNPKELINIRSKDGV